MMLKVWAWDARVKAAERTGVEVVMDLTENMLWSVAEAAFRALPPGRQEGLLADLIASSPRNARVTLDTLAALAEMKPALMSRSDYDQRPGDEPLFETRNKSA
jgi:hypothetical protein